MKIKRKEKLTHLHICNIREEDFYIIVFFFCYLAVTSYILLEPGDIFS